MTQQIFDPISFGFEWTADWYKFDAKTAEKRALAARNAEVKRLRKEGREVFPFTLSKQLRTMGGIGSGRPEISVIISAYGLNVR